MTAVVVEQLQFTFAGHVEPFQYESGGGLVTEWPGGAKVVDVVANEPSALPDLVWLLEAKDYRVVTQPPRPANLRDLAETVDKKVRSTLAALAVVAAANSGSAASVHAGKAAAAKRRRVVLHLEPHPPSGARSALFPSNFPVNVLLKLRQLVRDIDRSPLVLDIATTSAAGVPWQVK